MDRAALRQLCWDLLGVKSTDPFYSVSRVDMALNTAERQISEEIRRQAPDLERSIVTLLADASDSHGYTFATQAPPIVDFLEVLELRLTNSRGMLLTKVRDEQLGSVCGGAYSLIGADVTPVITTGDDVAAGAALWLKYGKRTPTWDAPSATPATVPVDYHDVIGLRALPILYALGGESKMPDDLRIVMIDRSGALWRHVGQRSQDPQLVDGGGYGQGLVGTMRR